MSSCILIRYTQCCDGQRTAHFTSTLHQRCNRGTDPDYGHYSKWTACFDTFEFFSGGNGTDFSSSCQDSDPEWESEVEGDEDSHRGPSCTDKAVTS